MRPLLLLLALVVSASAQKEKWTLALPALPEGSAEAPQTIEKLRSDTPGNLAFAYNYEIEGVPQFKLVWVSASGSLLHAVDLPNVKDMTILHVSASQLLVFYDGQSGPGDTFIRKYTRRNGSVTFVDTSLSGYGYSRFPGRETHSEGTKPYSIMVLKGGSHFPNALRRYNLR